MSTALRTDENALYWRKFTEWLEAQPPKSRADWVQRCIQEKGPAPDDIRDNLVRILEG